MRGVLRQAYGLAQKQAEDVDVAVGEHLFRLWPELRPTLPPGASAKEALEHIADGMLAVQYPDHPKLDPDRTGQRVRPADTTTVFRYVQAAAETDNGRVEVAKADRPVMRRVAGPLGLGEVHEAAFVLGRRWIEVFREAAPPRNSAGDLPVRELLRLLGDNGRYGLEAHVAALVVATYAEQTDRAWVRHGVPLDPAPGLGGITTDMALREQRLPEAADWATAGGCATSPAGPLRRPASGSPTPAPSSTPSRAMVPGSASTRSPPPDACTPPTAPSTCSPRSTPPPARRSSSPSSPEPISAAPPTGSRRASPPLARVSIDLGLFQAFS